MTVDQGALQKEQLKRVYANLSTLSDVVYEFCLGNSGRRVTMSDLFTHLASRGLQFAPDSPSRIFRKLRNEGRVVARVVDRRLGMYEIGMPV